MEKTWSVFNITRTWLVRGIYSNARQFYLSMKEGGFQVSMSYPFDVQTGLNRPDLLVNGEPLGVNGLNLNFLLLICQLQLSCWLRNCKRVLLEHQAVNSRLSRRKCRCHQHHWEGNMKITLMVVTPTMHLQRRSEHLQLKDCDTAVTITRKVNVIAYEFTRM